MPLVIPEAVAAMIAGVVVHRTGHYTELIGAGMGLFTLGTGLYIHLNATSPLGEVFAYEVIAGIGAGFVFEPPLIALQAFVKQDDVATATATFGFIRNLSTSISLVLGGVVLQNSMNRRQSDLRAAGLPQNLLDQFTGRTSVANVDKIGRIADARQQMAAEAAFAWSMRNMWILYVCVCFAGFLAAGFVSRAVLGKTHVETKTGIKERSETA